MALSVLRFWTPPRFCLRARAGVGDCFGGFVPLESRRTLQFTVISDDFETITCFSVPTGAYDLPIGHPWYQKHRKGPASIPAKRFCEIRRSYAPPVRPTTPKPCHMRQVCWVDLLFNLASLPTIMPRAHTLSVPSVHSGGGGCHFSCGLGDTVAIHGGALPLGY